MYELTLLARLIDHGSLAKYKYLLHADYFIIYPILWQFITEYEMQFGALPNRATVKEQFPDIELPESALDIEWLIDEVTQDFIAGQLRENALKMTTALAEPEANPRVIATAYIEQLNGMRNYLGDSLTTCIDALTDTEMTLAEFRRRMERGEAGVTLGLKLLDTVTNGGTKASEVEIFMGRPGDGKTMMLLYSCYRACKAGHDVAFLSPEMDRFEISARLDTIRFHLSNSALTGLPDEETIEVYREMMAQAPAMAKFSLHLPNERRFTTADVMAIADRERPGVIGIDGLLFLEPMKKYNGPRERIVNVMEELKNITRISRIPLRIAHQVNRQSEILTTARRRRERNKFDMMCEMHQLAESGSVEQFANRIFAIKHFLSDSRTYIAVRKNRNGKPGLFMSVQNNIDLGYITDEREESIDAPSDDAAQQPQQQSIESVTAEF